ncbi:MAG: hypothetical protein O2913_02950 [Chloroflexi bacterium]|nr:hypothetical protein [Chloroflexota bacterium]
MATTSLTVDPAFTLAAHVWGTSLDTDDLKDKFRDCAAHALNPPSMASVDRIMALILEPGAMADSRDLFSLPAVPE